MATVINSIMQPEDDAIKAHLDMLFKPLQGEYPQGLIELRHGAAFNSAWFNLRDDGIADAAAFASFRASAGDNVYVGVNPRKPGSHARGAGCDTDVELSIWHFADIDKAESLEGLGRKLRPLPPTHTINTGTIPHRRPHLYWQLEEPVRNMAAWTERQRGIAQALGGDSVINPSRIMRLAGTVNFPPQHKVQRGYRVELVTLKTEFGDEREPVDPGEVAQAFPVAQQDLTEFQSRGIPVTTPGQSTLSAMRPTRIHDLLEACRSGAEWHNSMIRLVAHLAATGRTTAEILAMADHITLPGYTVAQTQRDMHAALQGARIKWALPEPQDEPVEAEEAAREAADSIFDLFDLDELENMPAPSWLIHDLIVDDGLSVIYGDPGAGKSFIALDMALRLSNGMDWHGTKAMPTGVLYIAGEGKRGIGKRVKGWRKQHKLEGVEAPFLLLPTAVELSDEQQRAKLLRTIDVARERAGFTIGLIVVDTVSRALAGGDENSQEAMGQFVAACDQIKAHAGGALLGVHHSGKDKDRGMRGSTVLLGACDAAIRVSKEGDTVTLKTEKQKDAEESPPIYMAMEKVEWVTGLEEEQTTLVPALRKPPKPEENEGITQEQIDRAFGYMADAWGEGYPLSPHARARSEGRYAPQVLARKFGGDAGQWASLVQSWQETDCLRHEVHNRKTKERGLRVLTIPGR